MNESELYKRILDSLNAIPGVLAWRVHAGKVKVRGGWMQLAAKGVADIHALVEPGVFVGLEVKRPDGKGRIRESQSEWIDRVRSLGGHAVVVMTVDEAVRAVLEIREGALR